jgi:hypothetical protein
MAVAEGLAHTARSLVVMFVVLAVGLAVASNFSSLSGTLVCAPRLGGRWP